VFGILLTFLRTSPTPEGKKQAAPMTNQATTFRTNPKDENPGSEPPPTSDILRIVVSAPGCERPTVFRPVKIVHDVAT
jgi:hypothetical protein